MFSRRATQMEQQQQRNNNNKPQQVRKQQKAAKKPKYTFVERLSTVHASLLVKYGYSVIDAEELLNRINEKKEKAKANMHVQADPEVYRNLYAKRYGTKPRTVVPKSADRPDLISPRVSVGFVWAVEKPINEKKTLWNRCTLLL